MEDRIAGLLLRAAQLRKGKGRPRRVKIDVDAILAEQRKEDGATTSSEKEREESPPKSTPKPKSVRTPTSSIVTRSTYAKKIEEQTGQSSSISTPKPPREEIEEPRDVEETADTLSPSRLQSATPSSGLFRPTAGVRRRLAAVSPSRKTLPTVSHDLTLVPEDGKTKKRKPAKKRPRKQIDLAESQFDDGIWLLDIGKKRSSSSVTDIDVVYTVLKEVCDDFLEECGSPDESLALETFLQHAKDVLIDMLQERFELKDKVKALRTVERRKQSLCNELLSLQRQAQQDDVVAEMRDKKREKLEKQAAIQQAQRDFITELKQFLTGKNPLETPAQ
ncbi:uncharacterized protein [Oscarella lobularis]|uniref:uncharacterized protein n=1 Tax=Oscarella lobularis TaxID=121494 RepID=UPI003314479D